jgi:hypothetical protein
MNIILQFGLFLIFIASTYLLKCSLIIFYMAKILAFVMLIIVVLINLNKKSGRIYVAIISILITVTFIELAFCFIARSHGVERSLSNTIWFKKNWSTNSQGFRDIETYYDYKGQKILCIGDSYTAGYGIIDTASRYSNILQKLLSDNRKISTPVLNLGIPGIGTTQQFEIMQRYAREGDYIIWQYFGDDMLGDTAVLNQIIITDTLQRLISVVEDPLTNYGKIPRWFIYNSFTINYFFWSGLNKGYINSFKALIEYIYTDDRLFGIHEIQLLEVIHWCNSNNINLSVLIMPFLVDEQYSKIVYEDKIVSVFIENDIEVFQVSDFSEQLTLKEKIVNYMDAHANEHLNKIIADSLHQRILQTIPSY